MSEQRIDINGESYRVYFEHEDASGGTALTSGEPFLWIRQTLNGPEAFVNCIPSRESRVYDSTSLDGKRPTENQRLQDIERRLSAVERRTFSPLELMGGGL